MHYELDDILQFSRNVEKACGRQGIPTRLLVNNSQANELNLEAWDWKKCQVLVEEAAAQCQQRTVLNEDLKKYGRENDHLDLFLLEYYAQSINFAARYLRNIEKEISIKQLAFFNEYLKELNNKARVLIPTAKIPFPLPKLISSTTSKKTDEVINPAVVTFFESVAFQKLKKHRAFLKQDQYQHDVLDGLIHELEKQSTMEEIRSFLEAFYRAEDIHDLDNGKSAYQILNTGRNITENVLSGIGIKATTTISLIDELNNYAQKTNDHVFSQQNLPIELDPAVVTFFESVAFQKLKQYRNSLKEDKRSHRFFGIDLSVSEKYDKLNDLIHKLEEQSTMDGIKSFLEAFYKTQNTPGYDGEKTAYDILNTGQNITTRVLGTVGLLKTSTISLIDELNKYAQNTNDHRSLELN